MKICPYCGKKHSDEYYFCTYCDKELYPLGGVEEAPTIPEEAPPPTPEPAPPEEIPPLTPEAVSPPAPEEAPPPEPEIVTPITPEVSPPPEPEPVSSAPPKEAPPSEPVPVTPSKAKRKWLAVIAIIVIVAIASAAYLLLLPKVKSPPAADASVFELPDGTGYTINITKMELAVSPRGIIYLLQDDGGSTIATGNVSEIYSKEVNGIKFVDADADAKVSKDDFFFVRKPATTGYKLILKYAPTGAEFLKKTLP